MILVIIVFALLAGLGAIVVGLLLLFVRREPDS
jgi:hypothetical protein